MGKCKIIVNPVAGHGGIKQLLPQIELELQSQKIDYDLSLTEHPWHAAELAQQAVVLGYEAVVAAGGDGTFNEVLNGLMLARQAGLGRAALGLLPIGHANNFAFSMRLPTRIREACRALAGGRRRMIDIGEVVGGLYPQGRYFGNGVGIGFEAVLRFVTAHGGRRRQPDASLAALVKTLYLYDQAPLLQIELEDETLTQEALMISVMNGRRLGRGFLMAPKAQADDGLFDLCIMRPVSRLKMLRLLARFRRGVPKRDAAVAIRRARRVVITALDAPFPAHADGETLCTEGDRLALELHPQQLELITAH